MSGLRYVHVLYSELATSRNGEVCWLEGVYDAEDKAMRAFDGLVRAYADDGEVVLDHNDDDGEREWTIAVNVERRLVR